MMKTKLQEGIMMTSSTWIRRQSLIPIMQAKCLISRGKNGPCKSIHVQHQAVTLAATVTATGKMLPSFLIFKYKPIGHIAMHELGTYLEAGRSACQEMVWMDDLKMHEWIDEVLTLWKATWDLNNVSAEPPIFVLDAYSVHQTGSIVNRILLMGI
jgi:hypothetical protein